MATTIYLATNAIAYAIFAAWCTFASSTTATNLGFVTRNASGQSEYLVIYGGLQLGLAAFFAWLAMSPDRHEAGLVFALCLYVPIVLYRIVTLMRFWPVGTVTIATAVLEVA
ncbi:DUF4345 domain-containing protein, partial [bacterium]